jgi:cytochrome P450
MEPGIARMVDQLIDELPPNPDLISTFAARIPIGVIGNLLDIPEADRDPLRCWSLAILGALEPVLSEGQLAAGHSAVREFSEYLTTLIAARRAHPGDPETDVLTRLITGDAAGHLTAQELIHNCIFILNAGHETTTNLIGSGLALLYDNPQSLELLKDDPALIGPAVEEILRVQSPNQFGNRETAVDVQIGGVEIPAGRNLHLCIGAANRDQAVFERPDAFDIQRRPNRHLAFAGGPHVCIGLTLARMEARIALTRFIERHPDYQVTARRGTGRIRFRGYDMLAADLKPRIFGCATV